MNLLVCKWHCSHLFHFFTGNNKQTPFENYNHSLYSVLLPLQLYICVRKLTKRNSKTQPIGIQLTRPFIIFSSNVAAVTKISHRPFFSFTIFISIFVGRVHTTARVFRCVYVVWIAVRKWTTSKWNMSKRKNSRIHKIGICFCHAKYRPGIFCSCVEIDSILWMNGYAKKHDNFWRKKKLFTFFLFFLNKKNCMESNCWLQIDYLIFSWHFVGNIFIFCQENMQKLFK